MMMVVGDIAIAIGLLRSYSVQCVISAKHKFF